MLSNTNQTAPITGNVINPKQVSYLETEENRSTKAITIHFFAGRDKTVSINNENCQTEINTLEAPKCPTCLEINGQKVFRTRECQHVICNNCFKNLETATCPTCRTPLSTNDPRMDPLATSMLEINRNSIIKKNQKNIEKQIKEQLDTEEEEIIQAIKEAIAENDVIELKEFNLSKDSSALQKAQSELSPRSLLSSAAEQGANDVIAYFLQTGLEPHPNEDLISDAIRNGQYDTAESLILHAENFPCIKINPETLHDTPGQSHPLWSIANITQENLQVLQVATLLLKAGANPNFSITDLNGSSVSKSPLSLACQNGNMQLAELLLEHNADINGHSSEFMSPIFIAARYLQPDTLELLVNEGADIEKTTYSGQSLLDIAQAARNSSNDPDRNIRFCRIKKILQDAKPAASKISLKRKHPHSDGTDAPSTSRPRMGYSL